MRRLYLSGSFIALLVSLCSLWAYRFQRVPELRTWRLTDLCAATPELPGVEWIGSPDHPSLRLKIDSENSRVAARISIPGIPAVNLLHLRFRMSARGLAPGKEEWEDGRAMIEWHPPGDAAVRENDPVGSVRYDEQLGPTDFVAFPVNAPAVPTLRLEHLGRAGEFELSDLEISVVEERAIWKTGRWILMCAWLAWGIACVRSWPGIPWWRAILASTLWVFMSTQFVVPGPWKIQRSMIPSFRLGSESTKYFTPSSAGLAAGTEKSLSSLNSGPLHALGKLPAQGSFVLRVKHRIQQARPLLHALLLFAPTLVLAFIIGKNPTLLLMGILALSIELAQLAFGYGFDWGDVFDLATDAFGIGLAMWAYGKMLKRKVIHGG
jgi:hypothetical protein